MKKTLDSSAVRALLGVVVLALGIVSARVVVSSADVDNGSAAPETTATTLVVPENVGSMAGLVAGADLIETTSRPQADPLDVSELLAAQRAAEATSDATTTTAADETTTTTAAAADAEIALVDTTPVDTTPVDTTPATTPTTTAPETTTTTSPPTTTTTVVEETTTTTVASGSYSGVLSEAEALALFSMYFSGGDLDTAMRVANCESSYNTDAYNPAGYGGLFQHSIVDWPDRAVQAGWGGASIYDGEANTAVTAWLVTAVGGWSPWPNC